MAAASSDGDSGSSETSNEAITGASDKATATPVFQDPQEASKKCHQWVDSGLTNNAVIQFLVQHLVELGCEPPSEFIKCIHCPQPAAGGFGMVQEELAHDASNTAPAPRIKSSLAKTACDGNLISRLRDQLAREKRGESKLVIEPEIYLCQQYLESELFTHKTLVHELVHAVDYCRTKMDPLHNCLHMACTEVRAENLSGECSFWKELPRMKSFKGHGQECVRRRAILSVRANPNCAQRAEDYVDAALPRCFRDNYPFERHPNQR